MNKYKFYDTSALLLKKQLLDDENIIISSITLQELENIKVSKNKDDTLKAQARKLLHAIDNDKENIEVIIYKTDMMKPILEKNLEPSDDMKILACAFWCDCNLYPDDITFVTNDLALKEIAGLFFGSDSIESFYPIEEQYKGFKEVTMTQEELSDFYSNPTFNKYDLMINEYIIIREQETGKIIDKAKWDGETHKHITYTTFDSKQFGIVRPYKDDVYQQLAMDSLVNNQVTMLCGKPGSGKTFLAFGYLFSLLEKHAIDKIIVFCNPAVVRNSAQLGL